MAINNNSYSTNTNITFGSNALGELWFQAQSISIPGISQAIPKIGGRSGAQIGVSADSVTFTDLTIDMQIDNNWESYDLIYSFFLKGLNVEEGTFSNNQVFDLWVDIHLGAGDVKKKFWFYNCRLLDVGEIQLDVSDSDDTINEVSLTFQFDYFDYDNSFMKERTK